MKTKKNFISISIIILVTAGIFVFSQNKKIEDGPFVTYIVDGKKQDIKLYWKDDKQNNFKSILNLKNWLETKHKRLVFAMNAGMYRPDYTPSGLFIEDKKTITPINTKSGR